MSVRILIVSSTRGRGLAGDSRLARLESLDPPPRAPVNQRGTTPMSGGQWMRRIADNGANPAPAAVVFSVHTSAPKAHQVLTIFLTIFQ